MKPGIYQGEVVHQRFAPRRHRLKYRIFQVLLDLDRLDDNLAGLRLISHNRFNLFGICDRDHGPDQDDRDRPLRDRMIAMLSGKALYGDGDRLFLMTMPRVLGFVFNPICLYFVQRSDGRMRALVYEVNNTFGDRHSYVLPVSSDSQVIHQSADKHLHVSPFMDTSGMLYNFDLTIPENNFCLNIHLCQRYAQGVRNMLFAGFAAQRSKLDDQNLWRLFWGLPLMTLKVVAGIHWEALKIFGKGITLRRKPTTPRSSVSVQS